MEKLTKEIYIKHAKRMYAILNETSPLVKFATKKDFAFIIEHQLNVLAVLEKKFKKEKVEDKYKVSSLVKAYNKVGNKDFVINPKFKLDDDADYIDSMNYLMTYCRNIFKINLDDLAEGKQVKVAAPTPTFKQKTDVDDQPGMAMGMGMADFMDPRQNPYVLSQVSAQIQREMSTGKFYRYKTKPAAIPVIKWITIILSLLTALCLILMSVFAFLTNGLEITTSEGSNNLWTITDGIFYILFAGIGVFDLVVLFKSVLSKNENDKYFFAWQIVLIFLIGSIMAVLLSISTIFQFYFAVSQTTGLQAIGYLGWQVMWYISISLIGLTIIPLIIGGVKNPKVDAVAIDKRMNEIISQITAGFGYQPRPFEQKQDVQTPVDVKPTDTKKKDDKSSSSKKSKK